MADRPAVHRRLTNVSDVGDVLAALPLPVPQAPLQALPLALQAPSSVSADALEHMQRLLEATDTSIL